MAIALSVLAANSSETKQKASFKDQVMPFLQQVKEHMYQEKENVVGSKFRESALWPKFAIASLAPHMHSYTGSTPVTEYRFDIWFSFFTTRDILYI